MIIHGFRRTAVTRKPQRCLEFNRKGVLSHRSERIAAMVATLGGPTMFARIGVRRALNRGLVREFIPDRKDTHWGKRKLKRDL
jgi:hypothetical protein